MLRIRLMRFGRRHQPFYRLVVVPRRSKPKRAKYVEKLGWVNPLKHEQNVDKERVLYWLGQGAQPSDSAWNLFVREGIVEGSKRRKGRTTKKRASEEASIASPDTAEQASGKGEEASIASPDTPEASSGKGETEAKAEAKEASGKKEGKKEKQEAGGEVAQKNTADEDGKVAQPGDEEAEKGSKDESIDIKKKS